MSSVGVMCAKGHKYAHRPFDQQCPMIFLSHKPKRMFFNTWDQYWPEGNLGKDFGNSVGGINPASDVHCFGEQCGQCYLELTVWQDTNNPRYK